MMRLGADPEVFLCDGRGKHISAIGFIGADKYNPLQIPDMEKGFTLQEDNVALEFGIPPASSEDEFVSHIKRVMDKSREWFPKLGFSKLACTIFSKDQMKSPLAHIFGCEPDFNTWSERENGKPQPPHPYMRSAGGHLHIETKRPPFEVGRQSDLFLGVPSVLMDEDTDRKKLYGKSGAVRVKPYGVEYRVLGNFWLHDEKYQRWCWRAAQQAEKSTIDLTDVQPYIEIAINNNDKEMARVLVNEFNLEVV